MVEIATMMEPIATETDIRAALRHVVDPEIGVNIVDLGLVYRIGVEGARASITMTMTSPACPLAEYLKDLVTSAIRQHVPGVVDVDIHLEWEPPWDPEMMSDDARPAARRGPALMRLAVRRIPMMVVGLLSMACGMWLGLARLGWNLPLPWQDQLIAHGPLMVCGFLGTLISLERAVARLPMGICRGGARCDGRAHAGSRPPRCTWADPGQPATCSGSAARHCFVSCSGGWGSSC